MLRNTTYNSFGSFRERSGTSFGQIALVDLRGLGAGRTAVLINGRRVPGNPFTGTSAVDVNSIPLSAVERIEILTDSASAVYGADAIGGVINFIMKDDYEGAEILIGQTTPEASGADEERAQFVFGASGDKGKIIASVEYYQRDAIFDADRDYSAAQVNGPSFGDTVGVVWAKHGLYPPPETIDRRLPDGHVWVFLPLCSGQSVVSVMTSHRRVLSTYRTFVTRRMTSADHTVWSHVTRVSSFWSICQRLVSSSLTKPASRERLGPHLDG